MVDLVPELIHAAGVHIGQWSGLPAGQIGPIVRQAAQSGGFTDIRLSRLGQNAGQLSAKRRTSFVALRGSHDTLLMVCWSVQAPQHDVRIEWFGYSQLPSGRQIPDPTSTRLFGEWLLAQIGFWQQHSPPPAPVPHDPVVAPGEKVPTDYTGDLKDYSRFLPAARLAALEHGVLPLGRAAFGWGDEVRYGPRLFMPRLDGVPAEQFGVLLCAPQGSGKTHLLARWAAAAATSGASVFALDVKGTLRSVLEEQFRRVGASIEIREFTTDAHDPSDRCNFLSGLSADEEECGVQLGLLAEALLPKRESKVWEDVARNALKAVLKLGKLHEWHAPEQFAGGCVDLTALLPVVQSEALMCAWLTYIYQMEAWRDSRPARITAEECGHALSIAIDRAWELKVGDEIVLRGQRAPERTFQEYMVPLQNALEPYRASSTVGARVASSGPGKEIRLDRIGDPGRPNVTIFTAPESGVPTGKAVLAMVMRRLRHQLDKRRRRSAEDLGRLLILLDETARLEGFDPADFVNVSRDNRVGYMFVYQTLALIQPVASLHRLLRGIGTQIYLQEITGPDLEFINSHFYQPGGKRKVTSRTDTLDGGSTTETDQLTRSAFLDAVAAMDLPGGRRPAVVYIRALRRPFIVDLHDDAPADAVAPVPRPRRRRKRKPRGGTHA